MVALSMVTLTALTAALDGDVTISGEIRETTSFNICVPSAEVVLEER